MIIVYAIPVPVEFVITRLDWNSIDYNHSM